MDYFKFVFGIPRCVIPDTYKNREDPINAFEVYEKDSHNKEGAVPIIPGREAHMRITIETSVLVTSPSDLGKFSTTLRHTIAEQDRKSEYMQTPILRHFGCYSISLPFQVWWTAYVNNRLSLYSS